MIRTRIWFLIPVVIAGIYPFVAGGAPAPCCSMYMLLGRIIAAVGGESYSLVPTKWLTKIFVASDVVCFIVHLGGAGLMASSQAGTSSTGAHIVLAGLLIQIVVFGLFAVVAGVFHRRLLAQQLAGPPRQLGSVPRTFLLALYVTSGLVLVRNIVRVAEFIEGFDGYIILHEAFLYVFDALPMAAVMVIFNVWHTSKLVNNTPKARRKASGDSSLEMGNVNEER